MSQSDVAVLARHLYPRFVVLGIASLMAWNVYIVSSDFFRHTLRQTPLHANFESIFSILSNVANLLGLAWALCTQPKANHERRIRLGLQSTVLAFLAVLLLPIFGIEGWTAMVTALSALVVAAVAAAYVQCSVFGIIARLPPNCSEGFMSGQAIAGTVASAVQLVSVYIDQKRPRLKAEDWDEGVGLLRTRTAVYFGLSALFMALSMVAWKQLSGFLDIGGDPEYAAVAQELDDNRDTPFEAAMQEGSPRLARAQATADTQQQEPLQLPAQVELANVSRHADHPEAAEVDKGVPRWLSTPFTLLGVSSDSMRQLYTTYRETSTYAMIGAVVMGQTLAVFPPLTEAIVSSPQSWLSLGSALTAWHFLVFNLGDYFGRFMTQWIHCRNSRWLHIVNAARTALVPVFLLIPTHALPEETHVLLVVIRSDIVFLMLVFVLGWTNGWVATMALILGPQRAVNKEVAGSILGFSLGIGLVFGAIASYPILAIAGIS